MGKRTLICEGGAELRDSIKFCFKNFTLVSNTSDLIYHIFYTDTVFDNIIIGNDFEVNFNFSGINELLEIVEKYSLDENSIFFAIELGKVCKELSLRKGKKDPKIVIFSPYNIKENAKKNNMIFLSKNCNFYEEFCNYVEKKIV